MWFLAAIVVVYNMASTSSSSVFDFCIDSPCAATFTPLLESGAVNLGAVEALADDLQAHGIRFAFGMPSLSCSTICINR